MKWLQAYAEFVRRNYAYLILCALGIGIITGLISPAPGIFIRQFNTPLIVIMIGAMGFTVVIRGVAMAIRDWRAFILGLGLNFIFAPFLCWLLALLLLGRLHDLATGLILIGVVPCAGMALVWVGLLKGDVPLAAVINTATMLLAPLLIPPLMLLFAGTFIKLNIWELMWQLICSLLLPLLLGVGLREFLERKVAIDKYLPLMPAISATIAVLLMFMAIDTNITPIMKNLQLIPPLLISTALIFPILFAVAYAVSIRIFPKGKNIAITYSAGMKNLPIAIGIAAMSFKGLEMLPVAVGFALQMLTAVTFYQIYRRYGAGAK